MEHAMSHTSRRRIDIAAWLAAHDPLLVTRWHDGVVDRTGFDPRSDYVEAYWLVVLGPSCVLAARRFADWLDANPDGFTIELDAFGRTLGVGASSARHAQLTRTLSRLVDFGIAAVERDAYTVRTAFPPLARRQLKRLPNYLLVHHLADLTEHLARIDNTPTSEVQQ
jgi:hypothetical protein